MGISNAAAGAVAAPLLTSAATAVATVAFTVSPLQAAVFCGSYTALMHLSRPLLTKTYDSIHDILPFAENVTNNRNQLKNPVTAQNVYSAVYSIFQALAFGAVIVGTSALAPSLAIPFATGFATLSAAKFILGVGSLAALQASRKAEELGWI